MDPALATKMSRAIGEYGAPVLLSAQGVGVVAVVVIPAVTGEATTFVLIKTGEAIISFVTDEPRLPPTPVEPAPIIEDWETPEAPSSD